MNNPICSQLGRQAQPPTRCRSVVGRVGLFMLAAVALMSAPAWADDAAALQEAAYHSERYVHPKLNFAPCAQEATMDCGTLRVPIDYRRPWVGTVDLAVIRAKASQAGRRIGALFVNDGGPGGSGVDFVQLGVNEPGFKRLRERFDIVSFDGRGTHRSRALQCDIPAPASPAAAELDEFSKRAARLCVQQHGELVTSMSHNNMARDMDVLRRALGERQLSVVGTSFGAVLGAVYASVFPHNTRAALLDSAVTPNFHDGLLEFKSEQALSFELVLQHLDQRCSADPSCRLRAEGVSKTLDGAKARLATAPLVGPGGAVLTADGLSGTLQPLLSREAQWPLVVDALADARAGSFDLLFRLLAASGSGGTGGGALGNGFFRLTPQTLIRCNDFGTRRAAADYLAFADATVATSNRVNTRFSVAFDALACAAWPAADVPLIRPVGLRGSVPVLLVGSQYDPNTPFSWTRSMAAALGAETRVLRYQGGGHGVYARRGNTCIDQAGDAFLFDLLVPAAGSTCPALPVRFRSAGTSNAAELEQAFKTLRRELQRSSTQP
jgi:pimeloyl-ACP methyl ester carboxylesterase